MMELCIRKYMKSMFLFVAISFCFCQRGSAEESTPLAAISIDHREINDAEGIPEDPHAYEGLSAKEIQDVMMAEEIAVLEAQNKAASPHVQPGVEKSAPPGPAPSKEAEDEDLQRIFEEEYGIGKDLTPYRLRIGDRLYISIYGEANTGRTVMVDQTGSINYILVDDLFVLGKSIEELRYVLNNAVKKYFKHATIAITPVEFGSQYYTIMGEVNNSGKKLIYGKTSVIEAIAQAGGLREGAYRSQTVELADLSHAFLARDGDYIPIDFKKLLVEGDMNENVELANGDYIYIPNSLYKEIHVLGEVKSPTTFGFINTVSLTEAIAQGRGLTDRASSRICVIRGALSQPKKFLIDFNLIMRGLEPDFLLQPGDIVYAPPRRFTNLREIVMEGVRAFVSGAAEQGGDNQFIRMVPAAAGQTGFNPNAVITPVISPTLPP